MKKVFIERVIIRKHQTGWTIQEGTKYRTLDDEKLYAFNNWRDLVGKLKQLIGYENKNEEGG